MTRARALVLALLCAGAGWLCWGRLSASGRHQTPASAVTVPQEGSHKPAAGDPIGQRPQWEPLRVALQGVLRDLCAEYKVPVERVAAGICDIETGRYALHNGAKLHFGASIPKILILLAAFQRGADNGVVLNADAKLALARMVRESNNDDAGDMARMVGLTYVRQVALRPEYSLYDLSEGGLWTGCYYAGGGPGCRRDPVGGLSHAANARQILRFYWLLEHGELVSPEASERMKAIFLDERVAMTPNLFAMALAGRNLRLIRKWGAYETHYGDSALVTCPGRHYIMAVLVDSVEGDHVVEQFGRMVDDLFAWLGKPAGAFLHAEPMDESFGAKTASVTPIKVVGGVALVAARSLAPLGIRAHGTPSGPIVIERDAPGSARIVIAPGKPGAALVREGRTGSVAWRREPELISGTLYVPCDEVIELLADEASGGA